MTARQPTVCRRKAGGDPAAAAVIIDKEIGANRWIILRMLVALARSLPNLSRGARGGADLGAGSGDGANGTGLDGG